MSADKLHSVIVLIVFMLFCQIGINLVTDAQIKKLKDRIVDLEHRKE